jgi:hypothetical protein
MAILSLLIPIIAPGLTGGALGVILGVLKSPAAKPVIALLKSAVKGEHLSDEEKEFVRNYNSSMTQAESNYLAMHGRR